MYSKRVRLFVQIIGFLFCTIGLLYISMKIQHAQEGFQGAGTYDPCPESRYLNGKNFWLCNSEFEAQIKGRTLSASNNTYDGVCYDSQEGYYTCFTRPPEQMYMASEGVFIDSDPSDDVLPNSIINDVTTVCNDYNTTFANFSTTYLSTTGINKVISSAIGEIKYARTQLMDISTLYCATPGTGKPALTAPVLRACSTLGTAIGTFSNIPEGPKGMYFMSTTIATSIKGMDDLYRGTFEPVYKGFNVCSNIN